MFRHAVALVMLKAIAGIMQAQSRHQAVAGHLRHDRSSCNRGDDCIATYDGLAIAMDIDPVAAVHEYELRLHRQRGNGAGKRPQRGAQDIVAVNTPRRRAGHCNLCARADLEVKSFARFGIELLRIVKAARHALGIEDDRRRNHRPGQWSPTRFIASRDWPNAPLERGPLAPEGRTNCILSQRHLALDRPDMLSLFATHPTMVPAIAAESIVQLGACGRGPPRDRAEARFGANPPLVLRSCWGGSEPR